MRKKDFPNIILLFFLIAFFLPGCKVSLHHYHHKPAMVFEKANDVGVEKKEEATEKNKITATEKDETEQQGCIQKKKAQPAAASSPVVKKMKKKAAEKEDTTPVYFKGKKQKITTKDGERGFDIGKSEKMKVYFDDQEVDVKNNSFEIPKK